VCGFRHFEKCSYLLRLTKYFSGDKIENNEMGGACSTYGAGERLIQVFWWGNLKERDHLGDPGIEGMIILRWVFSTWGMAAWIGSSWLKVARVDRQL
jgi:hypothetical protein